jgi:tetratricopeptide (TPR) repeat protein
VLILDGLERVQDEGGHRRRGALDDLQLKRLVRALAGGLGAARALVTSRFPLVDLESFTGAGHRAVVLDDLEQTVAFDVLRAWSVQGSDNGLARLLDPLNVGGFYHALSVAVLGSYLGNFAGGDPNRAPEFSLVDAAETDAKAARLSRILEQYAAVLTAAERDLLARMALFPRGVKVEILFWIVQSGGNVAGALIGMSDQQLVRHLEKLRALGLVLRYETGRQVVYSAHPFLREFFRRFLGTKPEYVHESVRARLAPALEARPRTRPKDAAILDQYELLIEQTLLAGRVEEAFDLYWYGLGAYSNLIWVLGENSRGLRILERFVPRDDFQLLRPSLPLRKQSLLVNDVGLFTIYLGDLTRARQAFRYAQELSKEEENPRETSVRGQNLSAVEVLAGRFPKAREHAAGGVSLAIKAEEHDLVIPCLLAKATAEFSMGEISAALGDFERATDLNGQPLLSVGSVWQAEFRLRQGDRGGARDQMEANSEVALANDRNDDVCRHDAQLVRLVLPEDPAGAARHLQAARSFADRSESVEHQLRCFQSACELHRHLGDFPPAITEAEAGILLADTCDFGWSSIDLRIALAETFLAAGDARKALQNAREALDRSEHPDCQYAWGKADGLHFCGLAHLRLGERELARQRLTAALELRERLGHGRIEETRDALKRSTDSQ